MKISPAVPDANCACQVALPESEAERGEGGMAFCLEHWTRMRSLLMIEVGVPEASLNAIEDGDQEEAVHQLLIALPDERYDLDAVAREFGVDLDEGRRDPGVTPR